MAGAYYRNARAELMELVPADVSRILEIGCGAGTFRDHFGAEVEYWGVEPNETAAEVAVERLDRVLHGRYEVVRDRLPRRSFDLLVLNDVAEHTVDHRDFLRSAMAHVRTGGWVVGSVPNVRHLPVLFELLVKKDWVYRDEGVLDYTHLRFFTERSIRRELEGCGLAVNRMKGINRMSPAGSWLRRLTLGVAMRAACAVLGRDTAYLQYAFEGKVVDED